MMHAELPIIAGHVLMATDMLASMGQQTRIGNNTTLCLDVDSREEADRLYDSLSEGRRPRWLTSRRVPTGRHPRPFRHPPGDQPHHDGLNLSVAGALSRQWRYCNVSAARLVRC